MNYVDLQDVGRYNLPHPRTDVLLDTAKYCYNKLNDFYNTHRDLNIDRSEKEELSNSIKDIIKYTKNTGKYPGILSYLYNKLYVNLFTSQQMLKSYI